MTLGNPSERALRRRQSDGVSRITDSMPGIPTEDDIWARARRFARVFGRTVSPKSVHYEGDDAVMTFTVSATERRCA